MGNLVHGRRIMSCMNTFWHLRTIRNSFMQCFFKSIMFVVLYGTAPRSENNESEQ